MNADIKKTLLTTRPFKYLDHDELDRLIAYCQLINFSKGEVLLHQGKKGAGMYIIISGNVVVTAKTLGKDMFNLAILPEGNFVGEVSLIEKSPSIASVTASNEVACLLLSTEYFDMLGLFFPETQYKISKAIIEEICLRLKMTYEHLISLMSRTNMVTASLFSDVVKTFTYPSEAQYADVHIDVQQLQHSEFFKCFSKEEYQHLLHYSTLLNVPRNCVLIKEGEKEKSYYIILRGAVALTVDHQGKTAKLAVLGPMKIFGNILDVCESSSFIRYTTCEPSILLKIPADHLTMMKTNHITLWFKLFYFISKSFVALEKLANKLLIRLNSELYNR